MTVLAAIGHALAEAGSMTWQITWSLILGFTLSAIVQAVVRRQTVVAMLGDDRPATLARATGLGAASSSCSYAAVDRARSRYSWDRIGRETVRAYERCLPHRFPAVKDEPEPEDTDSSEEG